MDWVVAVVLGLGVLTTGCARRSMAGPATLPIAVAPADPPPPAPPPVVSPWTVPVRVLAWTRDGIDELGEWPKDTFTIPPLTAWYVEPLQALDAMALDRLVGIVRAEHVPGLSLRGQRVAASVGIVRDLPELHALLLDDTDTDDAALATLATAGLVIERLSLKRTLVADAGVVAITGALGATLLAIDLEDTAIGDLAARTLSTHPHLRSVVLAGTRISDSGAALLGALPELDVIDLGGTLAGPKTVAALRALHPRQVFLDHTHIGAELATLAPLAPLLTRFDVSELATYKPVDADVAWLAKAPGLVELGLSGSKVTDGVALPATASPELRVVHLADTQITAATITALAARAELRDVDLAHTPVDHAAAAALLALPELRILRLDGCWVGDEALTGPVGPHLEELYLSETAVTDVGMAILDQLPHLQALGLGKDHVGDETIVRIANLVELRVLVLSNVAAHKHSLIRLAALRDLERLYLDGTATDTAVVMALANLDQLQVLHLTDTAVDDGAVPTLRTFGSATELALGDTRIRSAITDLAAWPQLRTVSLYGQDIDDARLVAFAKATTLARIDLSVTEVTDPRPLAALPNLRELGLVQDRISKAGAASVKALLKSGVQVYE